jgi:hypothetical protein
MHDESKIYRILKEKFWRIEQEKILRSNRRGLNMVLQPTRIAGDKIIY